MDISLIQHVAAINWFSYMHERDDPYGPYHYSRFTLTEQLLHKKAADYGWTIKAVSLDNRHFYDNTPIWKITYRDFTGDIQLQDCAQLEYLVKKMSEEKALTTMLHNVIARKVAGKSTLQFTKNILKSHKKDVALMFFKRFNLFQHYETFKNVTTLCEQHPLLGNSTLTTQPASYWLGLRRFPLREQLYLLSNTQYDTSWRALPWDGLLSARNAWRKEGLHNMGAHQQWQHLLGFPLNNYTFHNTFVPDGFKLKTWKYFVEQYDLALKRGPRKGYVDSGMGQPLINLIHLFETPETIEKMCIAFNTMRLKSSVWNSDHSKNMMRLVHDLGDFTLLRSFTPDEKKTIIQWCQQNPTILSKLGAIQPYIREHGPLVDMKAFLMRLTYQDNSPVAERCAELNLPKHEYQCYRAFWEEYTPKIHDVLPNIYCESERFIIRKLEPTDLRGPMLGRYTSCCQHLLSTAKKTAIHGVISPYAGFYVLTDKQDNIMSQCYLWTNTTGNFIIDSIEGIFQKEDGRWPEVSQLWKTAIEQLSQEAAVFLGKNNYGMTKDIWHDLQNLGISPQEHTTLPFEEDSYFDGLTHYYLMGTPRHINPQQLPFVYNTHKDTHYDITQ